MTAPTTILVHLDAHDDERLTAEARRRGVLPDSLAQDLLRASLPNAGDIEGETETDRPRRRGLDALERFARLRADLRRDGYPTVDAEQLIRDGRDDLDARQGPWDARR